LTKLPLMAIEKSSAKVQQIIRPYPDSD